jgi:hypothetical protein
MEGIASAIIISPASAGPDKAALGTGRTEAFHHIAAALPIALE